MHLLPTNMSTSRADALLSGGVRLFHKRSSTFSSPWPSSAPAGNDPENCSSSGLSELRGPFQGAEPPAPPGPRYADAGLRGAAALPLYPPPPTSWGRERMHSLAAGSGSRPALALALRSGSRSTLSLPWRRSRTAPMLTNLALGAQEVVMRTLKLTATSS